MAKFDNFYRLVEMHESMQESLRNLQNVSDQQRKLIDLIENSDKKSDFEDFVKELKEQLEEMDKQYKKLDDRKTLLGKIITPAGPKTKQIIDDLLSALNVFGQ